MAAIHFAQHLAHVLAFRHGPRERLPSDGNVWDLTADVSEEYAAIARATVAAYFPTLRPKALRCSQIKRSRTSLRHLWPALADEIIEDPRLGLTEQDLPLWKDINVPGAYNMTPQDMMAGAPEVVGRSGKMLRAVADDLAEMVGSGNVGILCSHSPFADVAARDARIELGLRSNDGWLPGKGFESGAFLHFGYYSNGALKFCDYYSPIAA
ncbi:MAG TPA: hypothetical protein VJH91_02770 [Candidatus Paceibacterota bacterium]